MPKGNIEKWIAATIVLSTVFSPIANNAFASTDGIAPSTSTSTSTTPNTFSDLGQADQALQNAIQLAQQRGLITGDSNGDFQPQATITRQEFARVLVNSLHLKIPQVATSSFQDVSSTDWGLPDIEAVFQAGLMQGDSYFFRPNDPITREEMAVVLCKALGLDASGNGEGLTFQDKDAISPWAKAYVQAANEAGILQGDGQDFNPKQLTKRQEAAVVAVQVSNSTAHVIEDIQGNNITISGITYQIPDDLKGIFSTQNLAALKGAKINAQLDLDKLTGVSNLELNASGQAPATGSDQNNNGQLVLDGQGSTLAGNLLINGDYVTVQNLNVTGNVTTEAGVKQQAVLHHVQVKGNTVLDGGDGASFVMSNTQLGSVVLKAAHAKWQAQGSTTASDMTVQADANLSAEQNLGSCKVTIDPGVSNVQLQAQFAELDLAAQSNPKITLGDTAQIGNVVLPAGVKLEDVFANLAGSAGQIPQINGQRNPYLPIPIVHPPSPFNMTSSGTMVYAGVNPFTITDGHNQLPGVGYTYDKQVIGSLLSIKYTNPNGTSDPISITYDAASDQYQILDDKGQEVADVKLASSAPSLLAMSSTPSGDQFTPQSGITGTTPVKIDATLYQNQKVVKTVALPVDVDQTAPQIKNASYDSHSSTITITMSEPFVTNGLPPVSVNVSGSVKGDFSDSVPLSNGTDFTANYYGSKISIVLTDAGKGKVAVQTGSQYQVQVMGLYDFAGNEMPSNNNTATVGIDAY